MDNLDRILINRSLYGDFAGRKQAEVDAYYAFFGGVADPMNQFAMLFGAVKRGAVFAAGAIRAIALRSQPTT